MLDELERLAVGGKCEEVLQRIASRQEDQQLADDLEQTALPDFWAWINSIPVPERRAFIASRDFKDHRASVEEERRSLKITSPTRPYGVRRRVIREVIEWARDELGVELKASYVEDRWDDFRAYRLRL